jgi:hypothetical protein
MKGNRLLNESPPHGFGEDSRELPLEDLHCSGRGVLEKSHQAKKEFEESGGEFRSPHGILAEVAKEVSVVVKFI